MSYKYDLRGVSATKDEVHAAIKNLDKGIFPNAFCKVLPDIVGGDSAFCNIMHADTAGTKTSLAYLYWKETGDVNVWKGIAQDAIVMNLDDMACVGCVENIILSSTIGRNKNLITGEVISAVIAGCNEFVEKMAEYGVSIHLAGGETADVGDIVRTIDVGYTTFARLPRQSLVVNDIKPGMVVVGLASFGQASYETAYNSGIGSNGLTSARHDALSKYHAGRYPDSFDSNTPSEVVYTGSKKLTDQYQGYTVGQLLLSPTRTYLPYLKALLQEMMPAGIIHNSGGGQTKVQKFIQNCRVVKDNLFAPPPVFNLLQEESATTWKEMYQVFNMGCRLELYLQPEQAERAIAIATSLGIEAQIIGRVEASDKAEVIVEAMGEVIEY